MMQSQRKADKLQTKRFRNGSFSIRFKAVLENAFRRYNVMHSPAIFVVAGRLLRIVALKETAIVQKVSLRFIVATCQKISSFSSGPLPPPKPQSWIQKSSRTHRDNFGQRETKGKKQSEMGRIPRDGLLHWLSKEVSKKEEIQNAKTSD